MATDKQIEEALQQIKRELESPEFERALKELSDLLDANTENMDAVYVTADGQEWPEIGDIPRKYNGFMRLSPYQPFNDSPLRWRGGVTGAGVSQLWSSREAAKENIINQLKESNNVS